MIAYKITHSENTILESCMKFEILSDGIYTNHSSDVPLCLHIQILIIKSVYLILFIFLMMTSHYISIIRYN